MESYSEDSAEFDKSKNRLTNWIAKKITTTLFQAKK